MDYLAWVDDDLDAVPEGPWEDGFVLRPGLLLLRSEESRSAVYHAVKWSIPDGQPAARELVEGGQLLGHDRHRVGREDDQVGEQPHPLGQHGRG